MCKKSKHWKNLAITIIKDVYICNETMREMLNMELRVITFGKVGTWWVQRGVYESLKGVSHVLFFKLGNGYVLFYYYAF